MTLVKAVLSEQHHLLKERLGHPGINTPFSGTFNKNILMLFHLTFLLLTHGPPQQIGFAEGIAGQVLSDPHDLLLIHHNSIGFLENRLQLFMGKFNLLTTVLAIDKLRNQACIQRPGTIKGQDGRNILQG